MNSPTIQARAINIRPLGNNSQIPDTLILEIDDALTTFFDDTANMSRDDYSVRDLVSEAVMYISDENLVDYGLSALRQDVEFYHSQSNGFGVEDGATLGRAAEKLGKAIHKKFVELKAYLPDGSLPFKVQQWMNPDAYLPVPVMTKCLEFVSISPLEE